MRIASLPSVGEVKGWQITPPADVGTAIYGLKMEEQYPGGYIINTASNPALLRKHLLWASYNQSKLSGAGSIRALARGKDSATADEVDDLVKEGASCLFQYWSAGNKRQRILGIIPVSKPILVKTLAYSVDYVFGRRVKWAFSVDEFGNFYLPKHFPNGPSTVRELAKEAVRSAAKEDPNFTYGGITNRLPADVEAKVNPAYIEILKLRQGELSNPISSQSQFSGIE
jgi:hypothetical protein